VYMNIQRAQLFHIYKLFFFKYHSGKLQVHSVYLFVTGIWKIRVLMLTNTSTLSSIQIPRAVTRTPKTKMRSLFIYLICVSLSIVTVDSIVLWV